MKTICIVPCGKQKIWKKYPEAGPTPAKSVYTGPFAKKCQEYAMIFHSNAYLILSAKYGFLYPEDIVAGDYNVTFNDPSTNPITVPELIVNAREKQLNDVDQFIVIAGRVYTSIVQKVFQNKQIKTPLLGHDMFEMVEALNQAIKTNKPLPFEIS